MAEYNAVPPTALWEVLLEEHCALRQIKDLTGNPSTLSQLRLTILQETASLGELERPNACLARVYALIHRQSESTKPIAAQRFALCLSGGGIRSATLNLGLLQGLARCNWLTRCDYLSTVSGGGFIGSWLMAWTHRVSGGLHTIDQLLDDGPVHRDLIPERCRPPVDSNSVGLRTEPPEVAHLREYSNYLTPRLGLFSADTWSLIATYPRNLLINWLVLAPLMAAVIMTCWGFVSVGLKLEQPGQETAVSVLKVIGLTLYLLGIASAVALSPEKNDDVSGTTPLEAVPCRRWMPRLFVSIPVSVGVLILALITPELAASLQQSNSAGKWQQSIILSAGINTLLAVMAVAARFLLVKSGDNARGEEDDSSRRIRHRQRTSHFWVPFFQMALTLNSALLPIVTLLLLAVSQFNHVSNPIRVFGLATILRIVAVFLLFTIICALNSEGQSPESEEGREWWSRLTGLIFRFGVIFSVAYVAIIVLPFLFMVGKLGPKSASSITIGGALTGAYALFSGASSRFGAIKDINPMLRRGVRQNLPGTAALIFILLVFIGASCAYCKWFPSGIQFDQLSIGVSQPRGRLLVEASWQEVITFGLISPLLLLFASMLLALPVNINRFSLYGTYRSRLVRAYLGASRGELRQPDAFTGFDPNDNLPLHFLRRSSVFTVNDLQGNLTEISKLIVDGDSRLFHHASRILHEIDSRAIVEMKAFVSGVRSPDNGCKSHIEGLLLSLLNRLLQDPRLYQIAFQPTDSIEEPIRLAYQQIRNNGSCLLCNRLILEVKFRTDAGTRLLRSEIVRPLHVTNTTLNLVGGERLAWQQRKAKSFVFTPLHCGFDGGFRPSVLYGSSITLGGAMTISGAAASPNMGYHSSSLVTFLMTLFNIRLGCWMGNPAYIEGAGIGNQLRDWLADFPFMRMRPTYELTSPRFSFRCFLDEAFGRTNEKNPYVYLSDGGHFDNTALYEMVRRRNHLIIASDASCDDGRNFTDLGNAMQKIRVDLGVPITLIKETDFLTNKTARVATFRIAYSAVDQGPSVKDGILIYAKPSLSGNEPPDVYTYGRESPTFPHEATADQWFSEAQFESYRQLGELIAYEIVQSVPKSIRDAAPLGPTNVDLPPRSDSATTERPVRRKRTHAS